MKDYEIKHLKKELEKAKAHLMQVMDNHKALGFEDALRDAVQELSSCDNHPAELGSEIFEMEKQIALNQHQAGQIRDIDKAFQKMERGTYGLCDFCGKDIGFERLEFLPAANLCIRCERDRTVEIEDMENDYPVEEDVLEAPFTRTFLDGADQTGYDGEDAWQDVQRYGSSSGPQDISVHGLIGYYNAYYDGDDEDDEDDVVEAVDRISNAQYKEQLPDSHGHSDDGYVTEKDSKRRRIDYFGEEEDEKS